MAGKILVAGGSGFIGSHIVSELWKAGKSVGVLSRNPTEARGKLRGIDIDYIKGDVRDPRTLSKALKDVETIISCVQFPNHPVENPEKGYTYEKIDGEGTRNLVQTAQEAGSIQRIIYLSGAGVREGRPNLYNEPWFRGKLMAEKAIHESRIPYTIFRPSWVFGREDRSLNRFVFFAKNLPFIPVIGDGKNRIQPLFIRDLAKMLFQAVENPATRNQTYEIGGPEILTMDEIVRTILRTLGKHKPIVHQPTWLMKAASKPMKWLPTPPLSPSAIDFITTEVLVDNRHALEDFDIKLTPLSAALATYVTDSQSAA